MTTAAIVGIIFAVLAPSAILAKAFTPDNSAAKFPSNVQLIAIGGKNYRGTELTRNVNIFSISSNSHRDGAEVPKSLYEFSGTMLDGTIYLVGNMGAPTNTNNFFAYNVAADNWTQLPNFPFTVLYDNVAVALSGAVYSVGGATLPDGILNNTYKYELSSRKWMEIPTMLPNEGTSFQCGVTTTSGSIFLIAGSGGLFRSDDGAQSWKKLSSVNDKERVSASCAYLPQSNSILVAGGEVFSSVGKTANSSELYDVATDTWKFVNPMKKERAHASAVTIPGTDDVVVCGGKDSYSAFSDCELYDSSANEWKVLNVEMNVPRFDFVLFATQIQNSF